MVVKYKTMNDGTKAKIIYNQDGEEIHQIITKVFKQFVMVKSKKGNEYNVRLSDRVRLMLNAEVGDTAVIKTFKNGWLVTDLIKKGN